MPAGRHVRRPAAYLGPRPVRHHPPITLLRLCNFLHLHAPAYHLLRRYRHQAALVRVESRLHHSVWHHRHIRLIHADWRRLVVTIAAPKRALLLRLLLPGCHLRRHRLCRSAPGVPPIQPFHPIAELHVYHYHAPSATLQPAALQPHCRLQPLQQQHIPQRQCVRCSSILLRYPVEALPTIPTPPLD